MKNTRTLAFFLRTSPYTFRQFGRAVTVWGSFLEEWRGLFLTKKSKILVKNSKFFKKCRQHFYNFLKVISWKVKSLVRKIHFFQSPAKWYPKNFQISKNTLKVITKKVENIVSKKSKISKILDKIFEKCWGTKVETKRHVGMVRSKVSKMSGEICVLQHILAVWYSDIAIIAK